MSHSTESRASEASDKSHPFVVNDAQLLECVPGAVYVCDLDGRMVRYNRRAGELWGRHPAPGEPIPHDRTPMIQALRSGTSHRNLEIQIVQPGGTLIWTLVNIDPLRNESGEIVGAISCFQDITERKLAEQQCGVLANELNHRVKNTLSTIQSIANYTFRNGSAGWQSRSFESRLIALSKAHDLLTRESWAGADLRDIVNEVMPSVCGTSVTRFRLDGPAVRLPTKLALNLALALHELCANATKFGSLSTADGMVAIDWSVGGNHGRRRLALHWAETAGPVVDPPGERGFGTRMIERTLAREHDAKVTMQFPAGGLRCDIDVPLS